MGIYLSAFRSTLKKKLREISQFKADFYLFKKFYVELSKYEKISNTKIKRSDLYPCLYDSLNATPIEATYYFQDLWIFDTIRKHNPAKHFDIGSSYIFISYLARFIDVTMIDIRPPAITSSNVIFLKGSILQLPFADESIDSLSSMCVIEHIGLGRYGDPLDHEGTNKAVAEVTRVLKSGGRFYFSVPVGTSDVVNFNAHRTFNESNLLKLFANYTVIEAKYIYNNGIHNLPSENCIACYSVVKN